MVRLDLAPEVAEACGTHQVETLEPRSGSKSVCGRSAGRHKPTLPSGRLLADMARRSDVLRAATVHAHGRPYLGVGRQGVPRSDRAVSTSARTSPPLVDAPGRIEVSRVSHDSGAPRSHACSASTPSTPTPTAPSPHPGNQLRHAAVRRRTGTAQYARVVGVIRAIRGKVARSYSSGAART